MAKKKRYKKRSQKAAGIPLLIGLCLVAFLGIGAFYSFSTSWSIGDLTSLLQKRAGNFNFLDNMKPPDRNFRMAGVALGMSPKQVQKMHPRLSVATSSNGSKRAHYFLDKATYTVWFMKDRGVEKAYRMRVDKTFNNWTEEKIMKVVGRTYGRPATSDCAGQRISNVHRCRFSYLGKDGVSLGINIRTLKSKSKGSRVEMSLSIIDTLLEGKRQRSLGAKPSPFKRSTRANKHVNLAGPYPPLTHHVPSLPVFT